MAITRPHNERFPHSCKITRLIEDDPMEDEGKEVLIYEGTCRAYEKNTTTDKGEVLASYRGLSIPVDREGWLKMGVVPLEGDTVVVDRGTHKENGRVIDVNPANFRGTHLIWKYGRQ